MSSSNKEISQGDIGRRDKTHTTCSGSQTISILELSLCLVAEFYLVSSEHWNIHIYPLERCVKILRPWEKGESDKFIENAKVGAVLM